MCFAYPAIGGWKCIRLSPSAAAACVSQHTTPEISIMSTTVGGNVMAQVFCAYSSITISAILPLLLLLTGLTFLSPLPPTPLRDLRRTRSLHDRDVQDCTSIIVCDSGGVALHCACFLPFQRWQCLPQRTRKVARARRPPFKTVHEAARRRAASSRSSTTRLPQNFPTLHGLHHLHLQARPRSIKTIAALVLQSFRTYVAHCASTRHSPALRVDRADRDADR